MGPCELVRALQFYFLVCRDPFQPQVLLTLQWYAQATDSLLKELKKAVARNEVYFFT